jgi:tRNA A-37 threonylcarbamoyl transferase component Bud32/Tol biopolymer transport system component
MPAASVITSAMLAPGVHAGRYEIVGRLGAGSMGIVFEARDDELDRTVALKLVHSRVRDGELAQVRLRQEAKAMARLSHSNVASVFDIGTVGDQLFIAMELVRGQTLRDLVGSNRPWRELLVLAIAAGRGLAAAHEAGVVHRDFKPDNVLVRADGAVRVSDFGLARAVDGGVATTVGEIGTDTEIAGTPAYMSPESFDGIADALTDQYALAVAMYELLEGKRPFAGSGGAADRRARLASDSPRGWQRREIPSAVRVAIERGFAADRAARWPSVAELCAAVERGARRRTRARRGAIVVAVVLAGAGIAITARPRTPPVRPLSMFATAMQEQLTFSGDASMPALTRDGQRLAYRVGRTGHALIVQDLPLRQGQSFEGSGSGILDARWSPDGANILLRDHEGWTSLMSSNGRERRKLWRGGPASWSPDGSQIVSSFVSDHALLSVTDVRTGAMRDSTLVLPGTRWRYVFGWPDADRVLIFSQMQGHGHAIWIVRPDGTNARKIYQDDRSAEVEYPVWAAGGRAIYYQRLRDQTTEIVRLALDEAGNISDDRVVFSPPTFGSGFAISDDEQSLVYSRVAESSTVAVTSGGKRTVLAVDTREKRSLSISRDGRTIVFFAGVGERWQIVVVPREGGETRTLPIVEGRPLGLALSPFGDQLAYTVATTEGRQLWTVALATGVAHRVRVSTLSELGGVAWTARGELLFQTEGNRNYGVLVSGKPEHALVADDTKGWMFGLQPSPDGHRAAVLWNRALRGVWVISLDDGSATWLWPTWGFPIGWSANGASIFIEESDGKAFNILEVNAGDGSVRTVLEAVLPDTELEVLPTEEGFAAIEVSWQSDLWWVGLNRRRLDALPAPLPAGAAPVVPPRPRSP